MIKWRRQYAEHGLAASTARYGGTQYWPVLQGRDFRDVSIDFTIQAAAEGLRVGEVRQVIRQLVRAHLVEAAAGGPGRWRIHDLLRLYAGQLSDAQAEADGREQVRDRLPGLDPLARRARPASVADLATPSLEAALSQAEAIGVRQGPGA